MKKFLFCSILSGFLFVFNTAFAQFVSINGQFKIDTVRGSYDASCCAVPYYLATPDTLSSCFLTRVHTSLPVGVSVLCYAPQYLDSSAPTTLHLLDSGDVWMTYIGDGDWLENSICFYTYPYGMPPTSLADSMLTLVFPNATLAGYGGGLHAGDKVYLGRFPTNTCFGFALVDSGWSNVDTFNLAANRWHIDSFMAHGNDIYCSDPHLNEIAPGHPFDTLRHVVALRDSLTNLIIIGFEDRTRGGEWQPNNDFCDVLFYLSTNATTGFDMSGYPKTLVTCDSTVHGGGGGGLESESLGGAVTRRDYAKIKSGQPLHPKPDYKNMPVYSPSNSADARTTGSSSLERFLPETFYVSVSDSSYNLRYSDSIPTTPIYTSPTDLTQITSATDVLAVDYVVNNNAKAVALAITTLKKAYNHTKSICDRFRGATLVSTDTMRIDGYRFILFNMLQPDGTNEYSITFDIGANTEINKYYLQSKWIITQYQGFDSVFNFQVWSTNPGTTIRLTEQILKNVLAAGSLTQVDTNFALPQSWIAHGVRTGGNLVINLTNKTSATSGYVLFQENKSEIAQIDTLTIPVTLTPYGSSVVSVPVKDGYQYEGFLFVNGQNTDLVYMADGNWSLDHDRTLDTVYSYLPGNEPNRVYNDSDYIVYRDLSVTGLESSYLYAYKFLTSGDEPVNLTGYNSLKFSASGNRDVTIKLLKDSFYGMPHQYQATVSLSPEVKDYVISLNDFMSDSVSGPIKANDITAIVFAFDFYGVQSKFNFYTGGISFSQDKAASMPLSQSKSLNIAPNPTTGNFECTFYADSHYELELDVADLTGRVFYRQPVFTNIGRNTVFVTLPQGLPIPGLFMVSLENQSIKYNSVKLSVIK